MSAPTTPTNDAGLPDWYIPDDLLAEATPAELEAYRTFLEAQLLEEVAADVAGLEGDWRAWLTRIFPSYVSAGFAPHHGEFWRWVWSIEPGIAPEAFVGIWPRGGAKSTSAELACVALAARGRRRYGLWLCATQDQADDHVGNVAKMLESPGVERLYPALARRAVGKFGNPRGWRRNRLWTADGFVLDAMGLDTAGRGVKLDEQRPDLIVADDLDVETDGPTQVERKITLLTRTFLPAGAEDLAVCAIQNLVHHNGVFARLAGVADADADFLSRRRLSGPVPAVDGLAIDEREGRATIVAGTATWPGLDLATCQAKIDTFGVSAFLSECQHDTQPRPGGMFDHIAFAHRDRYELPDLVRVVVWVDPAVTKTDRSDSMGVQADGIDGAGVIYRLFSWEQRATPLEALVLALRVAVALGAEAIGVETDQGGDTWASVYREAAAVLADEWSAEGLALPRVPRFRWAKAGEGYGPKTHRASRMLVDYEVAGRIVHVTGTHPVLGPSTHEVLERALRRFPLTKPLDLVDASFWSWADLRRYLGPVETFGHETAAARIPTQTPVGLGAGGRGGGLDALTAGVASPGAGVSIARARIPTGSGNGTRR